MKKHQLNNICICLSLLPVFISCSNPVDEATTPSPPSDSYFSIAVTDNSHNHVGSHLLFLDFVESDTIVENKNNVIISPPRNDLPINIDGDSAEWPSDRMKIIKGLPQNNFPLNQFVDSVATELSIASRWDEEYVYFLVEWEDASHTANEQYAAWVFGDQGQGQTGWNPMQYSATGTLEAPANSAINSAMASFRTENEDRLLLMFPIIDNENNFKEQQKGCGAFCHGNLRTDNPQHLFAGSNAHMKTNHSQDRADVWQWQASRSNPVGYAQDMLLRYSAENQMGLQNDSGQPSFYENPLIDAHPQFKQVGQALSAQSTFLFADNVESFSGVAEVGNVIPFVINQIPSGSAADIIAKGTFNAENKRWSVELRRARTTQYDDDIQFDHLSDQPAPQQNNIDQVDAIRGAQLYAKNCENCHDQNGEGRKNGDGSVWSYPAIQRVSGSQIMAALGRVSFMNGIESQLGANPQQQRQAVEDIAAFLQQQLSASNRAILNVQVQGTDSSSVSVVSVPDAVNCTGQCKYDLNQGGQLTLIANNAENYVFSHWSGNCVSAEFRQQCSVQLNSNETIIANYTSASATAQLNVSISGNGQVSDANQPLSINCPDHCQTTMATGSELTLKANPALNYEFSHWSGGACDGSTQTLCHFQLESNETVSAVFSEVINPTCENKGLRFDENGTNGFALQKILAENAVDNPTDMAFIPGSVNDFIVIEQSGRVKYFKSNTCGVVNTVDLRDVNTGGIDVTNGGEQGLLNIEFHPDFASNAYVFFYHTRVATASERINAVSRMSVGFDQEGLLVLSDPQKIIDFRKLGVAGNHNGGGLLFAPDKTLLASVGDGGSGSHDNAQDDTNLMGAVIRILPSLNIGQGGYSIPSGNKYSSSNPQCSNSIPSVMPCPEILAKGLRNPYRMVLHNDIVYLGDVGSGYEEINSFSYSNSTINFAWPIRDGLAMNSEFTDPILTYQRSDATASRFREEDPACNNCATGYASVMIGDVYRGTRYDGLLNSKLLHAEYMDAFMRAMTVDDAGLATDSGMHLIHHDGISAMIQGPDDFIYIVTQKGAWGTGDADMVYRLIKH